MCNSLPLDGRKALVIGGTKGIGAAVATRLREDGATVLITARARPDDLRPQDLFVGADITTAKGCAVIANAVSDQLGGIDIIVHAVCGSFVAAGGFAVLNDAEWSRALDLNLFPAVRLDRSLLPMMLKQRSDEPCHLLRGMADLPQKADPPVARSALPGRANSGRLTFFAGGHRGSIGRASVYGKLEAGVDGRPWLQRRSF